MFNGLVLTNKGMELLINQLNGHRIQFTVIKMGDGNKPADISGMTDLVSVKQTLAISRASAINGTTMLIGANLFGADVPVGFYWKEVGLFAKDLDGDNIEYLFSYDNAENQASYIPAGGAVTEQLIDLNVSLGNSDSTVIEIDESITLVTKEELDDALEELNQELVTKINSDVSSVNQALTTHIQNTNNPHGVSKSQVGLGSVENYGIASENEAKAGTVTNKYMTPSRVKSAIEALAVASDGNVIIKIGGTQPTAQSGKTIIWINTES